MQLYARRGQGASGDVQLCDLERRIPEDHPERQGRALADRALRRLDAEFDKLHAEIGWWSIALERLLGATLLMVLYSIRSERQLMEQMQYDMLLRNAVRAWQERLRSLEAFQRGAKE